MTEIIISKAIIKEYKYCNMYYLAAGWDVKYQGLEGAKSLW